ncbi:MAG: GNAT family N-acetyltransferase [Armatimonadetes bacterium]|nr:GNAT family N-acetyltransferase [Armatimonadota bacterium]
MNEQLTYRNAVPSDIQQVAEIFLGAFPESVRHYVGFIPKADILRDIFGICLEIEPDSFFVALIGGRIVGYILAPADFPRMIRLFVWKGYLLKMGWRWITGQYGIGLRPLLISARNWIAIWRETRKQELNAKARILSIAVHLDFQSRGIGTELLRIALEHLRSVGADKVRLEVRPDNLAAIHVYNKLGFEIKGKTRETQGDWLIMLKNLQSTAEN